MQNDFFTLLKFKTISADVACQDQMLNCVDWLSKYLQKLNFKTEIWKTEKSPILFAENLAAGKNKPTLLLYNHYDVQPVDPEDLWDSPPFEPTIRDGKIYARGAQDNKGQLFYTLQAMKKSKLPINIKWCIDGGEEIGSPELSKIIPEKKKKLKADYLAIVDLGVPSLKKPAITLGVRGIVAMDVTVFGSNTDMHSGTHGGIVYNPIHALVEVLAKMRDKSGKITIPNFYQDVIPLTNKEKKAISFSNFNLKEYEKLFKAKTIGGEKKFSPFARAWIRPTLEINGICGGYTGTGFKTVIPKEAHAKISCRLVPNVDPQKIGKLVSSYIKKNLPKGLKSEVVVHPGVGRASRADINSPVVQAFAKAYREVLGKPVNYIMEGGSIPIINQLQRASGSSLVMVGLGLINDNVHAPNEHFDMERIEKGSQIMAKAFEFLA